MYIEKLRSVVVTKFETFDRYENLLALFSTRKEGISPPPFDSLNLSIISGDSEDKVRRNYQAFTSAIDVPFNKLARTRQIHQDQVGVVTSPGMYRSTDALITDREDVYLAISTADCIPLFLFDPVKRVCGAVHSGWRGSEKEISKKIVRKMVDLFGVNPSDIIAVIGPSIGVCCYEVDEDIAQRFDSRFLERSNGEKPHLNLQEANFSQLRPLGVKDVEIVHCCTKCNQDLYYSYRGGNGVTGGMKAVIGMRRT